MSRRDARRHLRHVAIGQYLGSGGDSEIDRTAKDLEENANVTSERRDFLREKPERRGR